jgi:hypothetical protein
MQEIFMAARSLTVLASPCALVQDENRAKAYQELIEAQQNSPDYVTATSYPGANPIFTAQVTRMKQAHLTQLNTATATATVPQIQTASASSRLLRSSGCCELSEAGRERMLGIWKPGRLPCCTERCSENQVDSMSHAFDTLRNVI